AAILCQALDLYRDIGHVDGIAMASNDLGLLLQLTGDYEAAEARHLEALAICTDHVLPPLRACILNSLGELYTRTGNCLQARDYHTEALQISRYLPEPREEGRALEGIGRSYLKDNEPGKAQPMLTQAFEIYERIGILEARAAREMLSDANTRRH